MANNLDNVADTCPASDGADPTVVAGVSDAQYLVRAYHSGLSAERLLQVDTSYLTITDAGTPGTTGTTTIGLANSGVTAQAYAFPASLTVDAKGRVTAATAGTDPGTLFVPLARTISTTAPLTGGGALTGNLTLAISAATTGAAGSMSAADKTKLDGLPSTAYATVQNPLGTGLTQRQTLAFGSAFSVTDNVGSTRTEVAIASGGILAANLAVNSVVTAHINDLNVTTAKINDLAVTTGKIADDAVTTAKLFNLTGTSVLGRAATSSGDMAAITGSTPGHVLTVQGDSTLAFSAATGGYGTIENPNGTPVTQRQILAFSSAFTATDNVDTTDVTIATNGIAKTMIAQGVALSVLGRSSNSTGNLNDISTTNGSNAVLMEIGGLVGWSTIQTANIANNQVTDAKFRQSAGLSVVGKASSGTGNVADITATATGQVMRHDGTVVGFGTLLSTSFADSTITGARLTGFTSTTIPVANGSGQLTSSAITLASNVLTHTASSSGGTVSAVVENSSNTASSAAQLQVKTGGSSAGNPTVRYTRGSTDWLEGINGGSDGRYSLQAATSFSSTPSLSIHPTSGNVAFNGEASSSGFAKSIELYGNNSNTNNMRIQAQGAGGPAWFAAQHDGNVDAGLQTLITFGRGYSVGTDGSATSDPFCLSTNDGAGAGAVPGTNDIQRWYGNNSCIDLFGSGNTNFQSMVKGVYWANATTAPTGNPSGGIFATVESGKLKIRDPDGVVTTLN